eukprot:640223-Pyramimonas_sp.AAC.1
MQCFDCAGMGVCGESPVHEFSRRWRRGVAVVRVPPKRANASNDGRRPPGHGIEWKCRLSGAIVFFALALIDSAAASLRIPSKAGRCRSTFVSNAVAL